MGRPKHLLPFGEEVVLQRVVETLSNVTKKIVIVAAKDQELPSLPEDCLIVRDEEEFQGPLYGLMIGMKAIVETVDAVYLTGCDVPLLKSEFVQFIIQELQDSDVAVTCEEGFFHPLAAIYRTSLSETVAELVATGERRPRALFEKTQTKTISVEDLRIIDPQLQSLRNMNRPDDYAELLEIAGISNSTGK